MGNTGNTDYKAVDNREDGGSRSNTRKKGILFDLDGTLWDSAQEVVDSWNECLDQMPGNDYHITVPQMYGLMGKTMTEIAYEFFSHSAPEDAVRMLEECEIYENEYIRTHGGTLFPLVEETLAKLHEDYFLAIVSNCQVGYIEAFLEYFGFDKYFDDFEDFGRTGHPKGDNIRLVVDRNGLESAFYLGDTMGDYTAAKSAGVPFVHAAYGFGTVPEGTPAITAFEELPAIAGQILA